jgi:hypothetical protein
MKDTSIRHHETKKVILRSYCHDYYPCLQIFQYPATIVDNVPSQAKVYKIRSPEIYLRAIQNRKEMMLILYR